MERFLTTPTGWECPSAAEFEAAKAHAAVALTHPRLAAYYDKNRNYAGTSFSAVGTNPLNDLVPDDLLAVTLLSVAVEPHGLRALLEDGEPRESVIAALNRVRPAVSLADADSEDFERMYELHTAIKVAIARPSTPNSNQWVTASKIAARKRPDLMPVRDNVVGGLLGKRALSSAAIYYQLMRALLRDEDVQHGLRNTRERVATELGDNIQEGFATEADLRLLDAALWMYAIGQGEATDPFASAAD